MKTAIRYAKKIRLGPQTKICKHTVCCYKVSSIKRPQSLVFSFSDASALCYWPFPFVGNRTVLLVSLYTRKYINMHFSVFFNAVTTFFYSEIAKRRVLPRSHRVRKMHNVCGICVWRWVSLKTKRSTIFSNNFHVYCSKEYTHLTWCRIVGKLECSPDVKWYWPKYNVNRKQPC